MEEPPVQNTSGQETAPVAEAPDSLFSVKVWIRDLAISVIIAVLIIVFLYQPVKVEGTSMMPELTDQERIFINKFVYKFGDIQRGDVVVFWYPRDTSKSYIKRVIGLPGEKVRITGGRVFLNGRELNEPYVRPAYLDYQSYPERTVEPDHYYVLGDHRNSSNDSREWWTVPRENIYGQAVLVYWPVEKFQLLR